MREGQRVYNRPPGTTFSQVGRRRLALFVEHLLNRVRDHLLFLINSHPAIYYDLKSFFSPVAPLWLLWLLLCAVMLFIDGKDNVERAG